MSDEQVDNSQTKQSDNGGEHETGYTPPATQEDLNRIIDARLKREREKFADYKDLQAKAAKLDQIEQANKSETDKMTERITALERELESSKMAAMRARVQARFAISDEDADLFLTGSDEETLTRQAERLAARESDRKKNGNHAPLQGRQPASAKSTTAEKFAAAFMDRT